MLLTQTIPAALVYEELDGKPLYRKGYKEVLEQKKSVEEIMGSSVIQALIVGIICAYIKETLKNEPYWVFSSEAGVHLSPGNNLANDVSVFEKALIKDVFSDHYADVPPRIAIEVDTKIESESLPNPTDYIFLKSEKLIEFGVERVLWVLTGSRKIMMTDRSRNWSIHEWDETLPVFDHYQICLSDLLKKEGVV